MNCLGRGLHRYICGLRACITFVFSVLKIGLFIKQDDEGVNECPALHTRWTAAVTRQAGTNSRHHGAAANLPE